MLQGTIASTVRTHRGGLLCRWGKGVCVYMRVRCRMCCLYPTPVALQLYRSCTSRTCSSSASSRSRGPSPLAALVWTTCHESLLVIVSQALLVIVSDS